MSIFFIMPVSGIRFRARPQIIVQKLFLRRTRWRRILPRLGKTVRCLFDEGKDLATKQQI